MSRGRFLWGALPLLGLAACQKSDPILARVGGSRVTASAFLKEVQGVPFTSDGYLRSPAGRRELLDLLIRRKVILQAAQEDPTPSSELKTQLAALRQGYEERKQRLRRNFEDERERILVSSFLDRLKAQELKVDDAAIRDFWENQSEVKARHILVSDRALAETLRQKIAAGEDFVGLAKTHSEDPSTGKQGGDLGFLLRGSLVPEFENVLFALKNGETSPPTPSPYGIHIIQRTGERRLSETPLDDPLKERIRQALESQKLQDWFDRAKPRYSVQVNEETLNDLTLPAAPEPPAPAK